MAGSSDYPTSVDNKTQLQDGIDYIEADNVNNAYVPINKTQTFIGANGKGASWSTDMLEYLANTKAPICTKKDGDEIYVSAGVVFIKNSGQTNRLMRRNTSVTTLDATYLDTGSFADDTYYYIYAVADSAATTFTCKISASASAPTGLTNFELIGWFFNESASVLDITSGFVGNVKANGRDVPNSVTINGSTADAVNDTSYGTDLTESSVRFYSSGRPVVILYSARCSTLGDSITFIVDVDGTDKSNSERGIASSASAGYVAVMWQETLSAGTHTITIQAKVSAGSDTVNAKVLSVFEL